MQAHVGDRLIVRGHHQGELARDAEILRVGPGGEPPFLVRWSEDGRETLYFPSSDAHVEAMHHRRRAAKAASTTRTRSRGSATGVH